ncbi:FapA family protein [Psychrobacillus sp. NPDC093180]|uniref:FapA family protein n=1 Tax=Psychrobacillus sp. NPDC093180 TaxID=3364489 RepID=UPI00381CC672
MNLKIIEQNEEITLTENNGRVFIAITNGGYNLKKFDELTRKHTRLKVSNFLALKNAMEHKTDDPIEIGSWIESMELEISADKMEALLTIYESQAYIQENLAEIHTNIQKVLQEQQIIYGHKPIDLLNVKSGKTYIVATGLPPQKGENAKVTYLDQAEKRPVIKEDGNADFFDMNFIVEIKEGSWLGEKIPPQKGVDGINIVGENVPAEPGDDIKLKYDTKSAYEVEEDGKTVLRSKTKGIIGEINGVLSVQKHLVIDGDVGLETGNLTFDGSIQVKGTVMAGYSVIASGDISIDGKVGVNAAELIKSTEGDVFIRGGIFGRGVTKVEAYKNIFVKHANECTLEAKDTINIGFYALGSIISANQILLDERKGKIIGGKTIAVNSITAAYSGNSLERKTELIVQGIDRKILKENAKEKAQKMIKLQEEMSKLEIQIDQLKNAFTVQQIAVFEQTKQKYNQLQVEIKEIDTEIKRILRTLRQSNDYYIHITKEANAGTMIQIGYKSSVLSNPTKGKFKIENGELNV